MKRLLLATISALLIGAVPAYAQGASATFTFTIKSPVSTGLTLAVTSNACTQSGTNVTCTLPLAANSVLGTLSVAPSGWSGGLTLTGTTVLVIAGATPNYTLNVGATAITTPQTDTFTITATP